MLSVGSSRNDSTKVEIISAKKATDKDLNIPLLYPQDEVSIDNHRVWLATCLVIQSVDEPLAEVLLKQYHNNRPKYEWLYMLNRGAPDNRTLFNYLQWTNEYHFRLPKVKKPPTYNTST